MVEAQYFSDAQAFSDWLEAHRHQTLEVWVLFYKKGSGQASQTWSEAVDVALCFGWIDGLRKSVDSNSYRVRFTPRKQNSVWSAVNIRKVEALMRMGRMRPEGLDLFNSRKDSQGYSAETRRVKLDASYEQKFKDHQTAWAKFSTFAPSYRRDSVWWVMSAKKEETRLKRLDVLIASSREGNRIPIFRQRDIPAS
ncbi:YdeI/OmpD-associated family protein [Glutamicibacter halophytocola]|uniref:YdeI/OmpD-associated family protein n=1 Tax=Glutamicibacter halophytocola TaxID=1933880 RepID=UPI0015C531D1|nr:YdeI/OmpD-associated family protein [Glutamicibacter halophytocola]NQD42399.1 bacteriocin-protection protein [Glutamicibacter halophytocola]